ncbi:MAG TPA: nitroreductase family protein [Bacillota bacterium]|nr:nitroreductase family protein [Bacillota bacterium]
MTEATGGNAQGPERRSRFELIRMPVPAGAAAPALDLMTRHASVRSFRSDPLPAGALDRILVAAQSAPTSSNLQAYSIIVVSEPARRERLAELCGGQAMVRECPAFLVFCPDIHRLRHVCRRQNRPFQARFLEMFLLASMDAALAAENALLAAESLGLGACFCGSIRNNPQEVIDLLRLPEGTYALTGLALGQVRRQSEIKPRLPLRAIVHREHYSDEPMEDAVAEYDRVMAETRTYDGRHVSIAGEPPAPDDRFYGWAEHTARRLTRPETIAASASLRENLRRVLEANGWSFA